MDRTGSAVGQSFGGPTSVSRGSPAVRSLAVVPAVLGATALIAISASVTYNWFTLDAIPVENAVDGDRRPLSERPEAVWVVRAHTPMAAWGPLLLLKADESAGTSAVAGPAHAIRS